MSESPTKILIVDPDRIVLQLLAGSCSGEGGIFHDPTYVAKQQYVTYGVQTSDTARDVCQKKRPDIAIVSADVQSPLEGVVLVQYWRVQQPMLHVIMTSQPRDQEMPSDRMVKELLALQGIPVIKKPFKFQTLVSLVQQVEAYQKAVRYST